MLGWLNDLFNWCGEALLKILPTSPFQGLISSFSNIPYLGEVNWVIPIGDFIKIGGLWLGAIGLFYMYQIIMRWLKVIGD